MRKLLSLLITLALTCATPAMAAVFGQVRGVVLDTQHRPIANASITLSARNSALTRTAITASDGTFTLLLVPLGPYAVTASVPGFRSLEQAVDVRSDTSSTLHFELTIAGAQETVDVISDATGLRPDSATPSVVLSRAQIEDTPGGSRTNSLAIITDYVPGAYITHDMLHMRGGHQVSWLIDGVQIPNTNIASNVGAQIDPKDIETLEIDRGSYAAGLGDRTFGVFNVVPRSGFELSRQAELILSAGNYRETNNQLNFGNHSQRAAYYASLNGNRTDEGLSPPTAAVVHDAANGFGSFLSVLWNRTPRDQLRFVAQARQDFFQLPYDPDPASFGNAIVDSSALRDTQREADSLAAITWAHTVRESVAVQLSPFYHFNRSALNSSPADAPVATTADRVSHYGGLQASVTAFTHGHTLAAGLYGFGQHDRNIFGAQFANGDPDFLKSETVAGGVAEEYLSDSVQLAPWLTVMGGLRHTNFMGTITESAWTPRVGLALTVPRIGWVLRGFYGRFYQPPPLLTVSGPLVAFAQSSNTDFKPLHGERDEEFQFGAQIPLRGWVVDVDSFRTRIGNFLDHSNIGTSSIYFPVNVEGALVRAWELTVRSPEMPRLGRVSLGRVHLAYSNQIAEQRGPITGGLICAPVGSPQCDVTPGYRPVDHDQRNTLSAGWTVHLPAATSASVNVSYGSGFTNGQPNPATPYPDAYLPAHTQLDLSAQKRFGPSLTLSATGTNLTNQLVLLDNSLTFGGFHFTDPLKLSGELRYRFKW